jgi:outer membrane protein insertion porin family
MQLKPINKGNEDLERSVSRLMSNPYTKTGLFCLFLLVTLHGWAQKSVSEIDLKMDYSKPVKYEVGGITISGARFSDANAILLYSGIKVGDQLELPGDKLIQQAIKNLWKQKLFSDVAIRIGEIRGNIVFLNIIVAERPRMSRYQFKGISKADAQNLRDKLQLIRGTIVNDNLINNTENQVRSFYKEKGYYSIKVNILEQPEPNLENSVILIINISRGKKVKIEQVIIEGDSAISEKKVKKAMKGTREKSLKNTFSTAKFRSGKFKSDKSAVIALYNKQGYRDAKILSDSVWISSDNRLTVKLNISEGRQYFFGKINFVGNKKYSSALLKNFLDIQEGEVYNREKLDKRLRMDPNGGDISSLYMDDGYLTFTPIPVETGVRGDTIDMEIRIYEGMQFTIGKVIINGNTKTNEHVIRREIRTKPGELFSREDIIRTQRELSQLGYFNPEAFQINPIQHPEIGVVDIEYGVEEKPSDQIELSGGYGGGTIIGTVGLTFTNFSLRRMFTPGAWRPVPSGDGQRVSLRIQSNGRLFQTYSFSFTEPWLGGKKPNSLTFSAQLQNINRGYSFSVGGDQKLQVVSLTLGLGKRLTWPDDYFQLYQALSMNFYTLNNYNIGIPEFTNGVSQNLSYQATISRNSISQPIYPRFGSEVRFTLKLTPPYSLFNSQTNYADLPPELKYRRLEFYKLKFVVNWYTELFPKLVLKASMGFGYLGHYNDAIGTAPVERFFLGGTALSGFQFLTREIIGLRGYPDESLQPLGGGSSIAKYVFELRYPLTLSQMTTIYALGFFEAGNAWNSFREFDPFSMFHSTGIGLRVFLPAFGMLGIDYGWRLNDLPGRNLPLGQFHFTIGMNIGEL